MDDGSDGAIWFLSSLASFSNQSLLCNRQPDETNEVQISHCDARTAVEAATDDAAVGRADGRMDGGTEVRERFETEALYLMKSCSLNGWIFQ